MKFHSPPDFARAVYTMVRRIPKGRIATYGQVAAQIGHPRAARAVGSALARLPRHLESTVPWHRVVASTGISARRDPERAYAQRELLAAEGVQVRASGRIDIDRFRSPVEGRRRSRKG